MNNEKIVELMKELYGKREISDRAIHNFEATLSELSEQEEAVILSICVEGKPLENVANQFGLSSRRVEEIKEEAFSKLRHPSRAKRVFEE